jgi:hypothetical protein
MGMKKLFISLKKSKFETRFTKMHILDKQNSITLELGVYIVASLDE